MANVSGDSLRLLTGQLIPADRLPKNVANLGQ
jgi:hypothetical protein